MAAISYFITVESKIEDPKSLKVGQFQLLFKTEPEIHSWHAKKQLAALKTAFAGESYRVTGFTLTTIATASSCEYAVPAKTHSEKRLEDDDF
ncbi:MAG TPA: hypothetical protein VEA58_11440 [Anaerovoracaceae bacterium]|nr:hypothetical protein [Anaerovoracaceae bacterium]